MCSGVLVRELVDEVRVEGWWQVRQGLVEQVGAGLEEDPKIVERIALQLSDLFHIF